MTYIDFLNNKTLFYDKIDYDTIKESWNSVSSYINLPYIIHIVGTNGKGSTGRFLASFLNDLNKTTLHYSSPHIKKFNERIWTNGSDICDESLQKAHIFLQNTLNKLLLDKLTYFEYTTLMALYLSSNMDYLVLEAGLGGEFDASNVVKNNLTLIPSIGIDHTEFLGNTIKQISKTKLKSCDDTMILAKNIKYKNKIFNIANNQFHLDELELNENVTILELDTFDIKLPKFAKQYTSYFIQNMKLALSALEHIGIKYNINDFKYVKLFGRFEQVTANIIIDVGHNVLAATSIATQYENKKIILIYNSIKTKNYLEILKILQNIIKEVQFIKCNDSNMLNENELKHACDKLNIKMNTFNINEINANNNYLVFGSFKTVEQFLYLKEKNEK